MPLVTVFSIHKPSSWWCVMAATSTSSSWRKSHSRFTDTIACRTYGIKTRSGVTLDLHTHVHPGRACRFTHAVHWSVIPRKSRYGLTYFLFPVLIWQGNAIRSSRWLEWISVVFLKPFTSFRVSIGLPNPVPKQTNRQSSHQSGVLFFTLRENANN